jgi:phosphatidylserine decarboxylase
MSVAAGFAGAAVAAALALALSWKWQLGMRRAAVGLAMIGGVGGAAALAAGAALGLPDGARALVGAAVTLAIATGVLAYRFYRDPERTAPAGEHLVVSPADGTVVYVKRSRDGRVPVASKRGREVALQELTHTDVVVGEAVVVGIAMSFLDVHVNRAPIAGRVLLRRHFAGHFGSLGRPESVFENERVTTLIGANGGLEVAVVQIASRLVRQIASFVGEGDKVALGQRIGVIRLGSQVDLVLPARRDLSVLVGEGDRVSAGTSVIAMVAAGELARRRTGASAMAGSAGAGLAGSAGAGLAGSAGSAMAGSTGSAMAGSTGSGSAGAAA